MPRPYYSQSMDVGQMVHDSAEATIAWLTIVVGVVVLLLLLAILFDYMTDGGDDL